MRILLYTQTNTLPLMEMSKNPLSGVPPIIHRKRISDKDLERVVLGQIQQRPDFTLFTQKPELARAYETHLSYRQTFEHDENLRALQSRSEFSRVDIHVSSSSDEVTIFSTGKPISEFVPYYVWHETSGVHCYNLTTGETTTGTNVTVALNNFAHPSSLARVHNDPKAIIRQVDQAFGIAQAKNEGRVLEINPSLLASFTLNHTKSVVDAGSIEYFEELVLPIGIEKIIKVDVFKVPSGYKTYDSERVPESKYLATIKYQGGVRTDSLTGKIIGTECTVLEVVSIEKDEKYEFQSKAQFRNTIKSWIVGSIAGLALITGGILAYLSSDDWAVFHTQEILREGKTLGDPAYYRAKAEREVADASPERKSLVETVIADDLVMQDKDAQARHFYANAVSLDPHNYYAAYGVLITDVIGNIACKKTERPEKVRFLFITQDEMVSYYTCNWKIEDRREPIYARANTILAHVRAEDHDTSLEQAIIDARALSASLVPIREQRGAFEDRLIVYSNTGQQYVRRFFDGGGPK